MKIREAFRRAFEVFFGHPAASIRFWTVEACLTLASLSPLLFLARAETRLWALLAVPLYLVIMLPARINAAGSMQEALEGGSLFSRTLGDTTRWGGKLVWGLGRGAMLAVWSAPLAAGIIIARNHVSGEMDGFTLMRMIRDFGGGDLMTGVGYLALIFMAMLLLVLLGCAFHSGDRHALVLGNPGMLRGQRLRVAGCWMCSLILLLPILIALVIVIVRYLPVIQNLSSLLMGEMKLPSTRTTLIILGGGCVLTLPLLPLRSLVIAARVNGIRKSGEGRA